MKELNNHIKSVGEIEAIENYMQVLGQIESLFLESAYKKMQNTHITYSA
ncbi:hypothetical protein [Sporosarcina sp. FA9]